MEGFIVGFILGLLVKLSNAPKTRIGGKHPDYIASLLAETDPPPK